MLHRYQQFMVRVVEEGWAAVAYKTGGYVVMEYRDTNSGVCVYREGFRASSYQPTNYDLVEMRMADFLKKALAKRKVAGKGTDAKDQTILGKYPALHQFLTQSKADGADRKTSTVLLFTQDGVWKACLNERENALALWVASDTVQGLFDALELALQADDVPWRANAFPASTKAKGKKGG